MVEFGGGTAAAKLHLSSYLEDAAHQVEMHPFDTRGWIQVGWEICDKGIKGGLYVPCE